MADLASTVLLKEVMKKHFMELDEASKDLKKPIAWCTSVGPAELLRALGFLVYFPENHGALLGATRSANLYIPLANQEGYSQDICSYLTSDIGAFIKGETPLSRSYPQISSVPRPSVLVFNTNQCRDVRDWFSWYARRIGVPCIGIETFRNLGEIKAWHVRAIAEQLRSLIPTLSEISKIPFDIDRLREVLSLSKRCSDLWKSILEQSRHKPSPITFFDACIHMGPAVVARGTNDAIEYYEHLLTEVQNRVQSKVGAIDNEKVRIYWEGMPVWGKLRSLSNLFSQNNASVVASTYCNSWIFDAFDPKEPFESMALAYLEIFIVRSEDIKERYIERMVRSYNIDGIVFHDAKTCPNNSNNRYGMHERISKRLGLPFMVFQGDLCDLRLYNEEQTNTQIEAFLESLCSSK